MKGGREEGKITNGKEGKEERKEGRIKRDRKGGKVG